MLTPYCKTHAGFHLIVDISSRTSINILNDDFSYCNTFTIKNVRRNGEQIVVPKKEMEHIFQIFRRIWSIDILSQDFSNFFSVLLLRKM